MQETRYVFYDNVETAMKQFGHSDWDGEEGQKFREKWTILYVFTHAEISGILGALL